MARSKPKKLYPVKSLSDANLALCAIGDLKRRIVRIETGMNAAIDRLKAGAEIEAAPLRLKIAEIEAGLEAYAAANKTALFTERRSQELGYGTIGYRKASKIKPKAKFTWAMVLGLLKEMKFPLAVRTKEEVNKEELSSWPAERLDLIGARRVEKDDFWYEVKEEKLADTAKN